MIRSGNKSGFTLIELMIVVAIIAIIASVAIPKLMSARLAANEGAAIATLRSISSAQAQIQSSSAIDTDADGGGEYGYFGELAGSDPLRVAAGAPAAPMAGTVGTDELNPSVLSSAFGNVVVGAAGEGIVQRSGYNYQIWLPSATGTGIAEAVGGGSSGTFPDSNNGEIVWCAYAWPTVIGSTGNRAFFVNQEGDLLQMNNRVAAPYTGATRPTADAAFSVATFITSPLAVGVAAAGTGTNIWVPVQ